MTTTPGKPRRAYTIRGNGAVISAALKQVGFDLMHEHELWLIAELFACVKGVLYHDVDKGQPCFGCNACPGFEMHFWRKVCMCDGYTWHLTGELTCLRTARIAPNVAAPKTCTGFLKSAGSALARLNNRQSIGYFAAICQCSSCLISKVTNSEDPPPAMRSRDDDVKHVCNAPTTSLKQPRKSISTKTR